MGSRYPVIPQKCPLLPAANGLVTCPAQSLQGGRESAMMLVGCHQNPMEWRVINNVLVTTVCMQVLNLLTGARGLKFSTVPGVLLRYQLPIYQTSHWLPSKPIFIHPPASRSNGLPMCQSTPVQREHPGDILLFCQILPHICHSTAQHSVDLRDLPPKILRDFAL